MMYYPQAYLLHYLTYNTPKDGPPDTEKLLGFLDPTLKISRLGLQKFINVAKIKGVYFPEAVFSKIMSPTTKMDRSRLDDLFFNMDNHKIASLTPELKLYRVDKDFNKIRSFYFPNVSDFDFLGTGNLLDVTKAYTGNATGIESFSVTLTGKNPFQASRNFLDAQLVVKVDSVASLFDMPAGFEDQFAPLADLFTIRTGFDTKTPGSGKKANTGVLETGKSCQILATLGYSTYNTGLISAEELSVLRKTFQFINLFYKSHDLQMQQDGSATITINYTGFLEAVSGSTEFDMMKSIKSKKRLEKAKAQSVQQRPKKDLGEFMSNKKLKEKSANEAAKTTEMLEVERPTVGQLVVSFGEIVDNLYKTGKIHVMSTGDVFASKEFLLGKPQKKAAATAPLDQAASRAAAEANLEVGVRTMTTAAAATSAASTWRAADLTKISPKEAKDSGINPFEFLSKNYICYVTFGDLLDSYCKKVGDDLKKVATSVVKDPLLSKDTKERILKRSSSFLEELRRLNVFMADAIYTKKSEASLRPEHRRVNISDIPVSIDTLYTLFYSEIVNVRKPIYDLNDFIVSFMPKLLTRSFAELPGADMINSVSFTTTVFSSRELSSGAVSVDNKSRKISIQQIPSPIQQVSTGTLGKVQDYIIIHQRPSLNTLTLGSGKKDEDLKNGIYHLRTSQNSGIVKTINFSKISSPAREAYMIVRNGNIYDELRFAHNASVEMIGNNIFYPSCVVYINPDTLGFGDPRGEKSAARRLGFGGYYNVGNVTTTFSNGDLSTSMELHYVAWPDTESQAKIAKEKKKKLDEVKK